MEALSKKKLVQEIFLLIEKTSTSLPEDVRKAIIEASLAEEKSSTAKSFLESILKNIEIAEKKKVPICQDTGSNIYYIKIPFGISMKFVEDAVIEANRNAVEKCLLRPNAVDSLSGKNSGDNTGIMAPQLHFEEWDKNAIHISLMLKGGGCENVSCQYDLPNSELKAGRNLEGVRKCVIDAVSNAQGKGCSPGIIGVGIGGDRVTGMQIAKKQLFRKLGDENRSAKLAELEKRLSKELNQLGIGPMGCGGKTTVLGVKAAYGHRLPASYFVSISYMCWACRRKKKLIKIEEGSVKSNMKRR